MSKLIFSTWQGEEFDDSVPPVTWPKALHTAGPEMTFMVDTPDLPQRFEIRQWKTLRPNGIPRGKPHITDCFVADEQCGLTPAVSSAGLAWEAEFEAPWSGHVYMAVMGSWDHGQAAWINHVVLHR